jgi:hypothetical protein
MADDDKISFLLDLDVAEFTEKGLQAKGIIEKLGSAESLTGLLEGLTAAAPALAAVGVAAYGFKKALDLTVEGEQIERVNNQFEILSKQAGIAPDKLKKGLEESAKGLVDTDDLLKIANEAIVKMGGSAEKLPQIMDIARKATAVYGGDAKSNFEAISEAIANGNTRALKHYGIIIDAAKAEREFAAANGVTAEELSDVGRRQAILNAALEKGNEAFKNTKENAQSATSILQTLKVTFSEIGQTFTIAFEKTIGPGMRSFLGTVQSLATKLKLHVQASMGDAEEAAKAKALLAGKSVDELSKKEDAAAKNSIDNIQKVSQASIVDIEKQKKQQQAFRQELEKIDKAYFAQQEKSINNLAKLDLLIKKQNEMAEKAHQEALQKIRDSQNLNQNQKARLVALEQKRYQEEVLNQEKSNDAERNKLLDAYVANSETKFQGIERAFRANTIKMQGELKDFGKQGTEAFNSLSSNATSAFSNMGAQMVKTGDIGQSVADALRGFFLGFLGDQAINQGTVMLLSGIWPPNPIAIAGGTALITLGGALKALAGPGASASTATGSPSVQASASGSAAPLAPVSNSSDQTATATSNMDQQQNIQGRNVQVNIAGNYLETDQSRRLLMNLIRQESDATGFSYNQIGA